MKKLIFASVLALTLLSCSKEKVTTIELKDVILNADGPYYEGPNSFQATLSNTLKDNGLSPETIDKVELTSATVILPDSLESGLIQDLSLQLVSSSSKIKKVAFINPLVAGQKDVTLTVAQEQDDVDEIFSKEEFIVLLDANFSKDVEATTRFKAKLTFNVTSH
jgi:hypothetical protein